MNTIKEARIKQGVTIQEMAILLDINRNEYIKLESDCGFDVTMFLYVCFILKIDINQHI